MEDIANTWLWLGFSIFLLMALSIDTLQLGKNTLARPHQSMRAALIWTLFWIACALIFNVLLWYILTLTHDSHYAFEKALDFFIGYLIEKSLSVDNLFVFYLIFHQLNIPVASQQRVLTYGIWSAIIMRLLLIMGGIWLVTHFHWLLIFMGAFLILTGIKMCVGGEKKKNLTEHFLIRGIKRLFRVTDQLEGDRFFMTRNHLLYVTPLFIALLLVELSDLVFALDSIPAIFAITRDPFLVWSSNIFAILGLRALYFLLAGMITRFALLKYGIALILIFVGVKMLFEPWLSISAEYSLVVIVLILLIFTVLSLRRRV